MNGDVEWSVTPLDIPDWDVNQASVVGKCGSCGRTATLRRDPYAGQYACKGCWEALVFGQDDD